MNTNNLPDVQNDPDSNHPKLSINKVGVRNIRVPFRLLCKDGSTITTSAKVSSYCNLTQSLRGINMSRISRTINDVLDRQTSTGFAGLENFAYELQKAHGTDNIWIKAHFEFVFKDKTPLSGILSYEPIKVTFESILKGSDIKNYVTVETVEMSLCPCSKEMSMLKNNLTNKEMAEIAVIQDDGLRQKILLAGFGAHNQRSNIQVKVELASDRSALMWIEDIVEIIKKGASSPTWSTLKRPDEKWVTEVSYMGGYFNEEYKFIEVGGGPKFVEDIVRHIAVELNVELDKRITDYCIVVNNEESIHSGDIMATSIMTAGRKMS